MLVRFDPFRYQFDRGPVPTDRQFAPVTLPMDVSKSGDRYVVRFDLPGIDPESIDLTVNGQELTLAAERSLPLVEGEQVLSTERPQGKVSRRLRLGPMLDAGRLEANYEHGVLTVQIPLAEGAGPRKVAIGQASGLVDALAEAPSA